MKLSHAVIEAARKHGVKVYYADRRITQFWNNGRDKGEPVMFGGWYWQRQTGGRVIETDENGPFRSESAAIRDAWKTLQLRHSK